MAKSIPLPKLDDLPQVVVFHRNHPAEQRLLLQVPTGAEEAETYIVRLDQTEHRLWLERLPNYKKLRDRLAYEMHVAFYPQHGGAVMTLEDPNELSWTQVAFASAHGNHTHPLARRFAQRGMRRRMLPRPRLRSALQSGGGR